MTDLRRMRRLWVIVTLMVHSRTMQSNTDPGNNSGIVINAITKSSGVRQTKYEKDILAARIQKSESSINPGQNGLWEHYILNNWNWKLNSDNVKKQQRYEQQWSQNRIRRSQFGTDNEQTFYDESKLNDITARALQHCPYADFCYANGSAITDIRVNMASCCKDCYCDEACGERMDCCFDFLDKSKIAETKRLTCTLPKVTTIVTVDKIDNIWIPRYLMVDRCLESDSDDCKHEPAAIWGSLYPVYAPSKGLIYFNRHCAHCNGVNDTVDWTVYVACNQAFSFTLNGQSLLHGIENGSCEVQFRPPNKASTEKFICYTDVTASCNTTGLWTESDELIQELCESTRAVVQVTEDRYANIFCKFCNGVKHYPADLCKTYDDSFRTEPLESFIALVKWDVIESSINVDESVLYHIEDTIDSCQDYEVKHPNKAECRLRSCPNGAIRTEKGCELYASVWYKQGFKMHVILKPVLNLLPLAAFEALPNDRKYNVKSWLKSNRFKVDSIEIHAETVIKQNVTYLGSLNTILGTTMYPLEASKLLKTVKSAMSKSWEIDIGGKKYEYVVQFDKYLTFIQNGQIKRKDIFGRMKTELEENFLPNIYDHYLFDFVKLIFFYINELYFCEQVDLLPDEWIADYQGIRLNLSGTGDGKFLGDAQFNYQLGADGEWKVQICVDEFVAKSGAAIRFISRYFSTVLIMNLLL